MLTERQRNYILARMSGRMSGNQWAALTAAQKSMLLDSYLAANPEKPDVRAMAPHELERNERLHDIAARPQQSVSDHGAKPVECFAKHRAMLTVQPGSEPHSEFQKRPAASFEGYSPKGFDRLRSGK